MANIPNLLATILTAGISGAVFSRIVDFTLTNIRDRKKKLGKEKRILKKHEVYVRFALSGIVHMCGASNTSTLKNLTEHGLYPFYQNLEKKLSHLKDDIIRQMNQDKNYHPNFFIADHPASVFDLDFLDISLKDQLSEDLFTFYVLEKSCRDFHRLLQSEDIKNRSTEKRVQGIERAFHDWNRHSKVALSALFGLQQEIKARESDAHLFSKYK